jgi:hypothetical protein
VIGFLFVCFLIFDGNGDTNIKYKAIHIFNVKQVIISNRLSFTSQYYREQVLHYFDGPLLRLPMKNSRYGWHLHLALVQTDTLEQQTLAPHPQTPPFMNLSKNIVDDPTLF